MKQLADRTTWGNVLVALLLAASHLDPDRRELWTTLSVLVASYTGAPRPVPWKLN